MALSFVICTYEAKPWVVYFSLNNAILMESFIYVLDLILFCGAFSIFDVDFVVAS